MGAVGAGLPRSNLPVCLGPRVVQQGQRLSKDGPGAPPRTAPRLPLLRVRGTLALLCLSAVTLTYVLWQVLSSSTWRHVHPEEGPTASWGLGSSLAWAPLGGEAWRRQQNGSCRGTSIALCHLLLEEAGAQVRHVPMGRLTGGVLHSKFWVVDGRHVYVGSANMDWRSLTQVKELGAIIYNCSRLAQDLEKTFQTYWVLGVPKAVLPKPWPRNFSSHINCFQPLRDYFDGVPTAAYFSASPPALCPHGRTRDLDALLAVMGGAREFIYASVMEYFPTTRFTHPARYWPVLDTALRAAAVGRGVRVHLLVSCWLNTDPSMFPYLRSLQALSNPAANVSVDVKVFIVPVRNHSNIPFSRVNHSKFMVTEKAAYIGEQGPSREERAALGAREAAGLESDHGRVATGAIGLGQAAEDPPRAAQ
ncbi:Phospholipase D4, partial [Eschrichtius robustus]|nr:Phospholipase D4 [Eschrichtius robustus]